MNVLFSGSELLAQAPIGGVVTAVGVGAGCLGLAAKAFSEQGIPFTNTVYITGIPAKLIGIPVGLLGATLIIGGLVVLVAAPSVRG